MPSSVVVINAVGLTQRLLQHAPNLKQLAESGWQANMPETLPAVTCTAQATLLTGKSPQEHGIVANGWLFRESNEVRFWQQSNRLMQAEPVYVTAKKNAAKQGKAFTSAKLFWWFNQGADVDYSVTPKPWYGLDGNKLFDISTSPEALALPLKKSLGGFPFPSFWGPNAGLPSTAWIANCAVLMLREKKPNLTLVYLPHLDYEPQRTGPSACDMPKYVRELDAACLPILDAAKENGATVWVVSEYGHCDVSKAVEPNRLLRKNGFLKARSGPLGEQLDLYDSPAFAVVDHQIAHIYIHDPQDIKPVREIFESQPGVAKVLQGQARSQIGLDHPRSGELILLSQRDTWFAYPFWLNDNNAPDYARSVAIHSKPGFDPCELFWDPKLFAPKFKAARRLIQKKLGFRTTFDMIPLDHSLVRGSHGLAANDAIDRPILIGHGRKPADSVPMTDVKQLLLNALDLA